MLPKALDCADMPLIAVFMAPNKDMEVAPANVAAECPPAKRCARIVPVACSEDCLASGMLKGGVCAVQAEPARQLLPTATASDRWLAYASTYFLAHSLLTFAARTSSMQPYLLAAVPTQAVGRALPPPPSLVGGAECSQTGGNPPFVAAVTKALTDRVTANSVAGSSLSPALPSSQAAPAGSPILESNLGALQRVRYALSPDRPAA